MFLYKIRAKTGRDGGHGEKRGYAPLHYYIIAGLFLTVFLGRAPVGAGFGETYGLGLQEVWFHRAKGMVWHGETIPYGL